MSLPIIQVSISKKALMLKHALSLLIVLTVSGCYSGNADDEDPVDGIVRRPTSPQYLRMAFRDGPPDWSEIHAKESQWASAMGLRFNRRDYPGPVEELWFRANLPVDL